MQSLCSWEVWNSPKETFPVQKQGFCIAGALWSFFFFACVCWMCGWGLGSSGVGKVKEKDLDCITSAVFRKHRLAARLPAVVRTEPAMCVCVCVWFSERGAAGGEDCYLVPISANPKGPRLPPLSFRWESTPAKRAALWRSEVIMEKGGSRRALLWPAVTSALLGWLLQKRFCDVYRSLTDRIFVRLQTYGNHVHDTFDDVALPTFKIMEIYFERHKTNWGHFFLKWEWLLFR